MTELLKWLATQHAGLRTYKTFRERALELCLLDASHRALYQLLANLAGHYVTVFDEEPLPVEVAQKAYNVFLRLVEEAERSLQGSPEQQLKALNEIAAAELF